MTAPGISSSQRVIGKSSETPARTLTKLLLKVWIAHSAAFRRCMLAGLSSMRQPLVLMAAFSSSGASLSKMCQFGLITPAYFHLEIVWYACTNSFVALLVRGSASM